MILWGCFFIAMSSNLVTKKYFYPLKYKEEIFEFADYYDLDRALVFSIVKVESYFDKNAVSKAGAKGLMQLTDETASFIAKNKGLTNYDLFDVKTNLDFGCYYVKYLSQKFLSVDTMLCAYNAGEGRVSEWLINTEYSSDKITLFYVPFNETREYVQKINESLTKYRKLYGKLLDKQQKFE